MQFPVYQVPYIGNGMTIALDAVLHVVISHGLAIGAVGLIVAGEYLGFSKSSRDWDSLSRQFLKFTVMITTSLGAVTGAGIWLITSALSPRGIGSLLRVFFWPWFIEWGVFTCEVIAVLLYYFTWDSWTGERKKQHLRLGAAYVGFALSSAFLITGILGFMLTPDGWPWDKSFFSAFFNASFLPQLLLRISGAFGLGALFFAAFLFAVRKHSDFRTEVLRFLGSVFLASLAGVAGFSWWYFSVVPSAFKTHAVFSVLTSRLSQHPAVFSGVTGAAALLLLLFGLSALRRRTFQAGVLVVPALLLSLGLVAQFERIREFIRGPYLMPGYQYANQVLLSEVPLLDKQGALANNAWYASFAGSGAVTQGAYLFAQNCSMCHTVDGVNSIRDRLQGRPEDGIYVLIGHTHDMVPFMPPFSGNDGERHALARFLYEAANDKDFPGVSPRFELLTGGGHE